MKWSWKLSCLSAVINEQRFFKVGGVTWRGDGVLERQQVC